MNIVIKSLNIENFKGIKNFGITFGNKTKISGENATGKTTIFDAVTWLLFNKNSLGTEKFDIRPLDADGKAVDFVEIKVTAEFENTDTSESFTLEKKQKQKWTKHTGDETETFTGNVNEYAVNGFPKSEKDYKAYIADIIDEEHFKLLSSPTYFVNLPWKKQRETLMSLVSEETDLDFAKRVGGFEMLIPELELAPKTSDIMEKWKRTKKDLDARYKEFPVRIDELKRAKVDYNLDELIKEKARIESELTIANAKSHGDNALETALSEMDGFKNSIDAMVNKANNDLINERTQVNSDLNKALNDKTIAENAIRVTENEINILTTNIQQDEILLNDLGAKYAVEKAKTFDESKYVYDPNGEICPVCKRKLPDNEIEEIKKRFEETVNTERQIFESGKADSMKNLIDRGNEVKARIDANKATKAEKEEILKKQETHLNDILAYVSDTTKKLSDIPTTANLTGAREYDYLVSEYNKAKAKVDALQNAPVEKVDTTALNVDLQIVNGKIASAQANANIEKRIEELMAEQRETAQKIATAEGMLFNLDKFIKAKLENVSASINGKFSMVNFKLYNVLISNAIEETCECTYNGVPYSSLNNGMKICGGLDIINTLSKEFGKSVFVFVDNAEGITPSRIPTLNCQMITMSVTDDKELSVEKID